MRGTGSLRAGRRWARAIISVMRLRANRGRSPICSGTKEASGSLAAVFVVSVLARLASSGAVGRPRRSPSA